MPVKLESTAEKTASNFFSVHRELDHARVEPILLDYIQKAGLKPQSAEAWEIALMGCWSAVQKENAKDEHFSEYERATGDATASAWMKKHVLDYVPTEANSAQISQYIQDNNLPYAQETLEEAFQYLQSQGQLQTVRQAAPAPPKPEVKPSEFPWPTPLTAQIIKQMDRETYRKFYKNPQFRRQVDAVFQGEKA